MTLVLPPNIPLGPRAKIQRACKHIDDLQSEINTFLGRKPYRIIVEHKAHREYWVVKVLENVPSVIPLLIGDAAHNLRSALDHLVFELVNPLTDCEVRSCAFPFTRGGADDLIKTRAYRLIKRKMPSLATAIDAIAPHDGAGGNLPLTGLHNLDITDKHRLIVTVGFTTRPQVQLGTLGIDLSQIPFGPMKHGHILFNGVPHPNLKPGDEIPGAYSIQFAEGQPFEHHPVLELLGGLAQLVTDTIGKLSS